MIEQEKDESRLEYLCKVLYKLMNNTPAGNETIEYDGAECDGLCLADDFLNEVGIWVE